MSWAVLGLVLPSSARAEETAEGDRSSFSADLDGYLGFGHDTNPTFSASADDRRLPSGSSEVPVPSGFGETRLAGGVAIGESVFGIARFGWTGRQYFEGARQNEERLLLSGGIRARAFEAALSFEGLRFDRTETLDDAWAGRMRTTVAYRLFGVRLALHAVLGGRIYTAAEQRDRQLGSGLELTTVRGPFFFGGGMDVERRDSTVDLANRVELGPWLAVGITRPRWEALAQSIVFLRRFDDPERSGREHVLRVRGHIALFDPVWLLLGVEYAAATGNLDALRYRRVDAIAGLRIAFEHRPSHATRVLPPRRQGPARLEDGEVVFALPHPTARRVVIIATFNDWDEGAGELLRDDDGVFRGRFTVPSGRHRYRFLVDGEPFLPPNAGTYVDDDFGGRDAVLYVP